MSKVKLVALRRHPYATGFREPDESYEAEQADAETLIALGWAKAASKAEDKALKADEPKAEKKGEKQSYRTRDLKAKG